MPDYRITRVYLYVIRIMIINFCTSVQNDRCFSSAQASYQHIQFAKIHAIKNSDSLFFEILFIIEKKNPLRNFIN